MNKKSIIAIEKILNCINELEIMCTGRDDNYFYDSYEMPILCDLVNEVEINLNKVSTKLKRKYKNVNWCISINWFFFLLFYFYNIIYYSFSRINIIKIISY